jgi:hypothetical protein
MPEGPVSANVAPFAELAHSLARHATLRGKLKALFVRS